ncbi:hypothetical protein L3i22_082550 [Actinoplanes sp. L3-i22]|nr:hypothetical protein L3i22_082550 [Actinoplanes sp. L3-i22]
MGRRCPAEKGPCGNSGACPGFHRAARSGGAPAAHSPKLAFAGRSPRSAAAGRCSRACGARPASAAQRRAAMGWPSAPDSDADAASAERARARSPATARAIRAAVVSCTVRATAAAHPRVARGTTAHA